MITNLELSYGDKGIRICYTIKEKSGQGVYDDCHYDYKTEMYSEEDDKVALARLSELRKMMITSIPGSSVKAES